jgi:hypothetical protein
MGLVMNHLTRPESPASEPQQTFLFDLGQSNGGQHLRVTDHRASHGRILDDVVLLNYRQDVAAEFSHLAAQKRKNPAGRAAEQQFKLCAEAK